MFVLVLQRSYLCSLFVTFILAMMILKVFATFEFAMQVSSKLISLLIFKNSYFKASVFCFI